MLSWYAYGPLYLPKVTVVNARLTQKVLCCLTAVVAKLWLAAGVPGAVWRVEVDSQFDKYVDRSTPCEPICCVNISSSVWSLVLRSSVNWFTIGLQISAFPALISSPDPLYSILTGCHSHYCPSPFISPSDYSGTLLYMTTWIILHSECFAWRQATQRSPLFHSAAGRGPCFVGQRTAIRIRFLIAILQDSALNLLEPEFYI